MAVRCPTNVQGNGAMAGGSKRPLVLRPERIALSSLPVTGPANAIAGRVERLTYLGALTEYLVALRVRRGAEPRTASITGGAARRRRRGLGVLEPEAGWCCGEGP